MGEGGSASSKMNCNRFAKACTNTSKCWCQNTTFAEYKSGGPGAGAALKMRVGWSQQLTEAEAAAYTAKTALRGWTPLV